MEICGGHLNDLSRAKSRKSRVFLTSMTRGKKTAVKANGLGVVAVRRSTCASGERRWRNRSRAKTRAV